ncbi:protocadherin-17-like isoform X2 [Gigantopelta aegis]|uniref:protocadherin-17-like isoform X2 n=1 Tax=Gigantopelta aegis TaxID=1735272 RepID=UPI001B88AD0E|nr:protocadherin-17-like isoform X2 [Gigantopelta aegis]
MSPLCFWLLMCGLQFISGDGANLEYTVKEEEAAESFIGNIARDSKLYSIYTADDFQRLRYDFMLENEVTKKFTIDKVTSTLRNSERLDRESLCLLKRQCILSLDVGVYLLHLNTSHPDMKQILRLKITIEDINDHAPQFPSEAITLTVPESVPINHILSTSAAYDNDTGETNSVQSYQLIPKDGMFGLKVMKNPDGSTALGLEVKYKLDYETRRTFVLTVVAKDGGQPIPKSGTVRITVMVTDVNDNDPVFSKSTFNVTIVENAPLNVSILKLEAHDQDSELNGDISFRFSSRTSKRIKAYLKIDERTGDLYPIKLIDYEEDRMFRFLVEVSDSGSPPRSSQAAVTVTVEDVNDNAPQIIITLPPSEQNIIESAEVGTFIAHVSVFDADGGENGIVSCSIADDHFRLERFSDFNNYKIILNKSLDFEESVSHLVNVTCRDQGDIPRFNSTTFVVRVQDENDNPPVFLKEVISAHVMENTNVGFVFLTLTAADKDGPGNRDNIFSMIDELDSDFSVSPTGEVSVIKMIDRERTPYLQFVVIARDATISSLSSTATVEVVVDDENDNPPRFTMPHYQLYVYENKPVGSFVAKLNVSDEDEEIISQFRFSPQTDLSQVFSLESTTGVLRTVYQLNREDRKKFMFNVIVTDPFNTGNPLFIDHASVTVTILDVNDNSPSFIFPSTVNDSVYIAYHQPVGTIITTLVAEDLDIVDKEKLTFTIEQGNEKNLFFLNLISGEMIVAKELTSDNMGVYNLVVAAHDSGKPQHTTYSRLNVIVSRGNNTELVAGTSEDSQQYIVIVISLICVTIILCVAVFITICIIKKADRDRRKALKAKIVESQKVCVEDGSNSGSSVCGSPDSKYDNEVEQLKKKIKRELSFHVDEDSEPLDTTELTNGSSFSTFKNLTHYSSIDNKSPSTPQACSSVLTNNTCTPEHIQLKMGFYDNKKQDIQRLATERGLTRDMHKYPNTTQWLATSNVTVKRPEDTTSELSGGADTTDSGHGSNEDEQHGGQGSAIPRHDSVASRGTNV